MAKKVIKIKQSKQASENTPLGSIKKALEGQYTCYILITCGSPSADGQMQVEMNYEGDESLASFLIENASQVFDEKISKQESK